MRKEVVTLFAGLLLTQAKAFSSGTDWAHLRALTTKYPYGLIGDDFGLLTENDLAANTCVAEPTPFPSRLPGYPYWQCFETKNVRIECYAGKAPSEEDWSLLVFEIHDELGHQEYLSRRPVEPSSCREYRKTWRRLTHHQRRLCVSGEYIDDSLGEGENVRYWIFDKYKTKAGCDSYFDLCNTKKIIKEECAPAGSG